MKWKNSKLGIIITAVLLFTANAIPATAFSLRPSHFLFQAGGGMGTTSVGVGWKYGRGKRFETEAFVGVISKYSSSTAKPILSLKENYVPFTIHIKERISFEPLTTSIYLTTVLNDKFWIMQPDRYQPGYYFMPTKIRWNICFGQRITYQPVEKRAFVKKFSFYYELGTCDIYLLSALGNKYLKPSDWLQLCLGFRVGI